MLGGLPEAILSLDGRRGRHQQHSLPTDADTDHSAEGKSHCKIKRRQRKGTKAIDESYRQKRLVTTIGKQW
jgi:hypothetical protein